MSDFVAVQPVRFLTRESIKRALVLYRKLFVPDLGIDHVFSAPDNPLRADLEWLRDRGRLITLEDLNPDQLSRYQQPPRAYINNIARETMFLGERNGYTSDEAEFTFSLYLARFFAHYMNPPRPADSPDPYWEARNDFAYPELSDVADIATSFKRANQLGMTYPKVFSLLAEPDRTEGVLRLMVHSIPVPDSSTPFEQIIDFTDDQTSRGRLAGLKRWIWDAVHSDLSIREIEDKLEYELFLFEQHMAVHRLKHHMGTLETIIVLSAEILENLARFKFSNIAKLAFSMRRSQLDLMQTELSSPGRELAYLYRARKEFA